MQIKNCGYLKLLAEKAATGKALLHVIYPYANTDRKANKHTK
jgi:hypothetical protein